MRREARRHSCTPSRAVIAALLLCAVSFVVVGQRAVIIDTDPGMGYLFRDVDDGIMLVAALRSDDLEVVGVTTTFGNVDQDRALRKARDIVERVGNSTVPVLPGASSPTDRLNGTPSSRFIVDTVRERPGEITVLAAGPLTNVAAAIEADPGIASRIRQVVVVGGLLEASEGSAAPPGEMPYDLNFGSDPESAVTVIESGVPLVMVHIELCVQLMTERGLIASLFDGAGELGAYLSRQTWSWRLINAGTIVLWDVVGLNYLLRPDWYTTQEIGVRLDVQPRGSRPVVTVAIDESSPNRIVAPMTMKSPEAYWLWLRNLLAHDGTGGSVPAVTGEAARR